MKLRQLFMGILLSSVASAAVADFEPWTDYELSEGITNVTTVKVDSNMIDNYLEGLSQSWAPANEIAKELGHIEGYWIHVSQLPNSGDFKAIASDRSSSVRSRNVRMPAFRSEARVARIPAVPGDQGYSPAMSLPGTTQ